MQPQITQLIAEAQLAAAVELVSGIEVAGKLLQAVGRDLSILEINVEGRCVADGSGVNEPAWQTLEGAKIVGSNAVFGSKDEVSTPFRFVRTRAEFSEAGAKSETNVLNFRAVDHDQRIHEDRGFFLGCGNQETGLTVLLSQTVVEFGEASCANNLSQAVLKLVQIEGLSN